VPQTPLHEAVNGNKSEIVKFLLKNGADPNAVDVRFYLFSLSFFSSGANTSQLVR
jgi:ankyrin repeat protein